VGLVERDVVGGTCLRFVKLVRAVNGSVVGVT